MRIEWFLIEIIESPSPRCFVPCLVEIGTVTLEKKIFKVVNVFLVLLNYLPLLYPPQTKFRGYIVILMFKVVALQLNKLESPTFKDALCQVWLKMAQWFWRRRFLNFINVFSLFRYYLPLGKYMALHMNKIEFPSPKNASRQVWLKLATRFWRIRFLNFFYVFLLFDSPWKWTWHFNCTIFTSSFHQRILCAKFGYNWPSGSGEEDF